MVAASRTVELKVPMLSSVGAEGKMPSIGHHPAPDLYPTTPHSAAGTRTEPPASVPMANADRPAAMATAEPLLDPPGVRCVVASQGFHGILCLRLIPPRANSVVLVFPRMTQPARLSRATKLPS